MSNARKTLSPGVIFPVLSSAPSSPEDGLTYIDATSDLLRSYDSDSGTWRNYVEASALPTIPAARVYNSANISHSSSGSWQALTFNSERYDNDTIHSTSSNTGRLTATTAGVYSITGHIQFDANATGVRGLELRVNGSTIIAQDLRASFATFGVVATISAHYKLAATDYVELRAYQNSGGSLNMLATGNLSPEFAMAKVSDG